MAVSYLNPILKEVVFSDVNVTFTPHPVTGKLPVLKNADAVKRAVRNLILTNFGERQYDPLYGGNIRAMLFENADDPLLQDQLKRQIEGEVKNYEKMVTVTDLKCKADYDNNAVDVTLEYKIIGIPVTETIQFVLQRP